MRKNIYILYGCFLFLFLQGCSKVEIYNPNYYKSSSLEYGSLPSLVPTFVLCQELFAKKEDVEFEANLACSTIKRKAKIVKKQIFNTCYLLSPISNTYECVEPITDTM